MNWKKRSVWLLIPGLIGFLIFYLIPFAISFYYSLIDNVFDKKFVGLSNYIKLFTNEYFRLALKNTIEFTVIGVPVLVLLSFVLAVLLVTLNKKAGFLKLPFVLPVLLPSASVILIWKLIFGESTFSGIDTNWWVKVPVYLLFMWKNAGFNMVLFIAGISGIPAEIYEAAALDGASGARKHWYITAPMLLPTFFFVVILSVVNSFRIFKEVYLLYGSYPANTVYTVQHYMNNHFTKLNYQNLASGAVLFFIIVYIIVAIGFKIQNRLSKGVW